MKLITKVFLFLLLGTQVLFSQEEEIPKEPSEEKIEEVKAMFYAGISRYSPLGESFVAEAFNLDPGFEAGFDVVFKDHYLLGVQYNVVHATNENPDLVGGYKSTNISLYAINAGYLYRFNPTFNLSGLVGLGKAVYGNNVSRGVKFHDHATSLFIEGRFGYELTNNFGFYAAAKFRNDFMKIETAREIQGMFDQVSFLNFSVGVRLSFF